MTVSSTTSSRWIPSMAGTTSSSPASSTLGSAALFALAMLTRETVALFPAILTVALLVGAGTTVAGWRDRLRTVNVVRAAAFAAIVFAPLFAWRHVVGIWLHTASVQERPA